MKTRIDCVAPDLAPAVIARCSQMVRRGLSTAPEVSMAGLMADIQAKRALLWLVYEGQEPLATAVTQIVADDEPYVAVFGLGGRDMWKWARAFAERIVEYARAEGCTRVRFAGSPAWGRVVPHCRRVGTLDGQAIFERAAHG